MCERMCDTVEKRSRRGQNYISLAAFKLHQHSAKMEHHTSTNVHRGIGYNLTVVGSAILLVKWLFV